MKTRKNQRKFSAFALVALFVIFSMLATSVADAHNLIASQTAEPTVAAGSLMADPPRAGGDPGDHEIKPIDNPIADEDQPQSLPPDDETLPTVPSSLDENNDPEGEMLIPVLATAEPELLDSPEVTPVAVSPEAGRDLSVIVDVDAQAGLSCSSGDGWDFIAGLGNAKSYTYTAPAGKAVSRVCYLAGSGGGAQKITYDVAPPEATHTVTSTVLKPNGKVHPLNHVSFYLVDVVPAGLSLSSQCQLNGEHLWTVSNASNSQVAFTWSSTEPNSGNGIVDANSQTSFTSGSTSQTVTVAYSVNNENKTVSASSEACVAPQDMSLAYGCEENGDHIWTITNPNDFALTYDWYSTNGSSGSSSVSANGTDQITTDSTAQTMTIYYTFPQTTRVAVDPDFRSTSLEAEACKMADDDRLVLSYACDENGDHLWTVTNPNDFKIKFAWSSDVDDQGGKATVKALGSKTFKTNSAAQTVTITYSEPNKDRCDTGRCGGDEIISFSVSAEACLLPLVPLTLTVDCSPSGFHQWTISNPNSIAIDFSWSSTTLEAGTAIVAANNQITIVTSRVKQTLTITYDDDGVEKSASRLAEACSVPDLKLTFMCGYADDPVLTWRVRNTNSFPVDYTWSLAGSSPEAGGGTVPANMDVFFTTTPGDKTVKLFVMGVQVDVKAGGEACKTLLTLDFECLDDASHEWLVTNTNDFAQSFTWSSTSGESGSGSVAAHATTTFITNRDAQTVTIDYQTAPHPAKTTSLSAEACKLSWEELAIAVTCLATGHHQWTITNPNAEDVSFDWSSTTGETGTGIVLAGETISFVSSASAQTMTLTYIHKAETRTITSDADKCAVPTLDLNYICGYPGATSYSWRVTNGYDFDINYTWQVKDSSESGSGTVPSNGSTIFTTSSGLKKVKLFVEGQQVDDAWSEGPCLFDLGVAYFCKPDGTMKWMVSNPNSFDQTFDWSSTTGQSGQLTVGRYDSVYFSTDNQDQTISLTYENQPFAARTITTTAERCTVALSIDFVCGYEGDSQLTWRVTNPNNFAVPYLWIGFDWLIPVSFGGGSAAPGVSYFNTSTDVDWVKLIAHSTLDMASNSGPCLLDLSIDYICEDNGSHTWTVNNPNQTPQTFTWSSDNGDSGSGTVAAGGSTSFATDKTAQTVTLYYQNAPFASRSISLMAEACKIAIDPLQLSAECEDDGTHLWTVNNANTFQIEFSWSSTSGESGSATVPANGMVTFTSDASAQTVTIQYMHEGDPISLAMDAGICLMPLSQSVICLENGIHQWTVTNPNPFDLSYTWSSTSAQNGVGTVPANAASTFETDHTSQTVTIGYSYDSELYTLSLKAEVCAAPKLKLTYICGYPSDTQLIWRVRNSHDFDVPFTWDVYGSSESGSGIALANADTFFNTSLGNKTVRIFVLGQLIDTRAGGSTCKVDLELDYQCLITGIHAWTVSNGNNFDQTFDWSSSSGESGTLTVLANSSVTFNTNPSSQTLSVAYQNGVHPEKTITVTAEACKSPSLTLNYLCGYATDTELHFTVSNPHDVDINFDWEVVGEPEKGTGSAIANNDTAFTTSTGIKEVRILVEGYEIMRVNAGESCLVPLGLSFQCLDSGRQQWIVTNENKVNHAFTWFSTNGENGAGVVLAGEQYLFETANAEQDITVAYQVAPFPARTVVLSAEMCKIVVEPPSLILQVPSTSGCDWLVFHSLRDRNMEIYRLDGVEGVGGYQLINLSKNQAGDSRPSRSFDNAWVAFQSYRDGNYEIYVTDNLGQEQIRLTENNSSDINPMFSPDNVHIVYQSNRNGNWDLYLVNRITGEETQLTADAANETNAYFSMDKNWLAYESDRNGNKDIYLLNILDGKTIQLTDGDGDELRPAWSPDGQKIAFLMVVNDVQQLFVVDTDGNNLTQITDGDGESTYHSWSPDSSRLAYQSLRDGNLDIYTYDLAAKKEYRVTDNPGDDVGPTWNCGGDRLAYTAYLDGAAADIYQVGWQGGTTSYLTDHPATDKWSEWSPATEAASRGN